MWELNYITTPTFKAHFEYHKNDILENQYKIQNIVCVIHTKLVVTTQNISRFSAINLY